MTIAQTMLDMSLEEVIQQSKSGPGGSPRGRKDRAGSTSARPQSTPTETFKPTSRQMARRSDGNYGRSSNNDFERRPQSAGYNRGGRRKPYNDAWYSRPSGGGGGGGRSYGAPRGGFQGYNAAASGRGRLLHIEGLEFSVMEADLSEAFSTIGRIDKCWVEYDRTDRSTGIGGVIFARAEDAERAKRQYDGRILDGRQIHLDIRDLPSRNLRRDRGGFSRGRRTLNQDAVMM